jgi:hypothetical protein
VQVRLQLSYIEEDVPGFRGLVAWWELYITRYLILVEERAQTYAREAIEAARVEYCSFRRDTKQHSFEYSLLRSEMEESVDNLKLPLRDGMPEPDGGRL